MAETEAREVLKVLSWNIQSTEFAANPLEFLPPSDALKPVDRDTLDRLLEEAERMMLCEKTSVTLDELLGTAPLTMAGPIEKAPLDKLSPAMQTGLEAWLESRREQWQGMWPEWDVARAAKEWSASHEVRWQYWRRQTWFAWLCDDGSGGKTNPKLPKNSPVIDEVAWDLGLSSADGAYGSLPPRCHRSRLMADSASKQVCAVCLEKPKHMGARDFFKLLVWDLLLNLVLKRLPDAKIGSLARAMRPVSAEVRMQKVMDQLQKHDPDVAVLVEVPCSVLPSGFGEDWWVVHASRLDPVMNTVILARKDLFLEQPSAEEFLRKDGSVNPRFIGCNLWCRGCAPGGTQELHIVGLHLSGSGGDFGLIDEALEQAIKPHSILAGDFNKDLRRKAWPNLSLRPKLEKMVRGASALPMEYGTTCKQRSPFQAQTSKMFLTDFVMKTFLLLGERFNEYYITGCVTSQRRLPSKDIPSDHAPIMMHLSLREGAAGGLGPAMLGAVTASAEQLKDELGFQHFMPPHKVPCAQLLMDALGQTDALVQSPGTFKWLVQVSLAYIREYEELAVDGYSKQKLEELANVTQSAGLTDYRAVLTKLLSDEAAAFETYKTKATWLKKNNIKVYYGLLDEIADEVESITEHYACARLLLDEVFRPFVDSIPMGRKKVAHLKHPFRVMEKTVMRTVGVPWDLVRAQIICKTMQEISETLDAITNAPGIHLVGLNDRFSSPKQGWADCSVYIVSTDAKYRSCVAEVQLVHQKMLTFHDKFGMHDMYDHCRFGSELLVKWYNVKCVNMVPWSAACHEEPEVPSSAESMRDPDPDKTSFWFVCAEKLRDDGLAVLPRMQTLGTRSGWLVKRTLRFQEACRGGYKKDYLAVSHRWDTPGEPDPQGVQLQKVRGYLKDHRDIKYVWFDYWCMPQADREGRRTKREKEDFGRMLSQVNILYLGCSVLVVMDLTYISRFWTQFEAWLSMQKPCEKGLQPAPESERRCEIECIYGAPATLRNSLLEMWSLKTPKQAYTLLGGADVVVTNQSDKAAQLPKLLNIDTQVQSQFPKGVVGRDGSFDQSLSLDPFCQEAPELGQKAPKPSLQDGALQSIMESFCKLQCGRKKGTIAVADLARIFTRLGLEEGHFQVLMEAFGGGCGELHVNYRDFLQWVFSGRGSC